MVLVADGGITARTMSVLGLLFRLVDDVAIAHCGHRDDGSIDGCGQIGELRARLAALHHIHQCTQADVEYQHKQEVN